MRKIWIVLIWTLGLTAIGCDGDNSKSAGTAGKPTAGSSAPSSKPTAAAAGKTASATSATAKSSPAKLNVIMLTIDAMRADHSPWNGYQRNNCPHLTALAQQGVVYTHAYAVASYTAKAVGAMLTSRYPSSLYRSGSFFEAYSDANVFFSELLQAAGIRTMAGHSHKYYDRGKNLRQGFDVWKITPDIKFNNKTDVEVTSPKMTALALEVLGDRKNTAGQFFLWLHYMDPHDKYVQHAESPKFGRSSRDRYDAEIYYVDLHFKKVIDFAKQQPWWQRTAIIITADHGEAFGEHKQYFHGFSLYENLVRVPLVFVVPGVKPQRIDQKRSYIDLAPTIMDLMGQPPHGDFVGKSLKPEIYGTAKPESREPIVLDLAADTNNPPTRAIVQGDFKLIYDMVAKRYRLFNIKDDPKELRDLAGKNKSKLSEMKKLLEEVSSKIPYVTPYGGYKLIGGGRANGPKGPANP